MAITDKLSAIGNAIRAKTGKSDLMTLDEMPQEISSISTGGEGGDTSLADSIINKTITSYSSDSLTKIGDYAFYYADSLQSISIPNVTRIGLNGLRFCLSLEEIVLPSVTYIDSFGLGNCSSLKQIDCYSKVSFTNNSCGNLSGLEALILRSSEVCINGAASSFNNSSLASGTGYIYVPQALIEQYKVATNWVMYVNQFRAIEDYPEICGVSE